MQIHIGAKSILFACIDEHHSFKTENVHKVKKQNGFHTFHHPENEFRLEIVCGREFNEACTQVKFTH